MNDDSIATMQVPELNAVNLLVPIVGTAPLIMNRFSEKAKRQILDNAQGKSRPKEPKDPEAEYKASMHRLKGGDGYGFPATGFKAATVSAARLYPKSVTMVGLRQALFFRGEIGDDGQMMVRIAGEPTMREDYGRVGQGGTDLRYRAQFTEWSAVLDIVLIRSMLDTSSVLSLLAAGGLAVGIGDWRPERSGTFGTYQIDPARKVEVLD